MSLEHQMSAEDLFNQAFDPRHCRTARSSEYRLGVLDALRFRLKESKAICCPYEPGTAQADAYISGLDEGHGRARCYLTQAAIDQTDLEGNMQPETVTGSHP